MGSLTRDEEVAKEVGLVETEKAGDIYLYVLEDLIKRVNMSNDDFAKEWIDSGLMTRKLTKKPVMTRSYAATIRGIQDGVVDFILDNKGEKEFERYFSAGYWMGNRIWESMEEALRGPMRFLDWVQQCGRIIGKNNLPFIWDNPVGMGCVHKPIKYKTGRLKVKIGHQIVKFGFNKPTNKINVNKIKSSCSPNVVHSVDASHLLLTVDKCLERGVKTFACVHDSFGCHPDDATILLQSAKDAWVDIYSQNWLENWYQQWCCYLDENGCDSGNLPNWKEYISLGTWCPEQVQNSQYFFG